MGLELHIYDFDGTLFFSPDSPDWWTADNISWLNNSISMGSPCVPEKPSADWWRVPVVQDALRSCADPDVYAVLCTGRFLASDLRHRIPELLQQVGLNFDEILLNPGIKTDTFKAQETIRILSLYPGIQTVRVWEDNKKNIQSICKAVMSLKKECVPYLFHNKRHPLECDVGDLKKASNGNTKVVNFVRMGGDVSPHIPPPNKKKLSGFGVELFHIIKDGKHHLLEWLLGGSGISYDLLGSGSKGEIDSLMKRRIKNHEKGVGIGLGKFEVIDRKLDADAKKHLNLMLDPKWGIRKWDVPVSDSATEFEDLLWQQLKNWRGGTIGVMPLIKHDYWPTFRKMVQTEVKKQYGSNVKLYRGIYGDPALEVLKGEAFPLHRTSSWTKDKDYAKNFAMDTPGGAGRLGKKFWVSVSAQWPVKNIILAPVVLPDFAPDPDILMSLKSEDEFVIESPRKRLNPGQFKIVSKSRKKLPERVSARWMSRQAGIFEAPPVMTEQIWDWMKKVYAGHVLDIVENRIEELSSGDQRYLDEIKRLKKVQRSVARDIKSLKPGEAWRLKTPLGSPNSPLLGVKAYPHPISGEQRYSEGRGKGRISWDYPEYPLDSIIRRTEFMVKKMIENLEHRMKGKGGRSVPKESTQIKDLKDVASYLRKINPKPKRYRAKATKKFPVDLTGWKYAQEISNNKLKKGIEAKANNLKKRNVLFDQAQKLEPGQITKKVDFLGRGSGANPQGSHKEWIGRNNRGNYILYKETPHGVKHSPLGAKMEVPEGKRWETGGFKDLETLLSQTDIGNADYIQIWIDHFSDPVKTIEDKWKTIKVVLSFLRHKTFVGQWIGIKRELDVDVRHLPLKITVGAVKDNFREMRDTLRHEMQHAGQDLLDHLKMLGEDVAGMPSKRIEPSQKGPRPTKRPEHALRPVEFYTRLADEVEDFVHFVKTREDISGPIMPLAVKIWTAHPVNANKDIPPDATQKQRNAIRHVPRRKFFLRLYKEQKPKWQKAVSEFYKAVLQKLPERFSR